MLDTIVKFFGESASRSLGVFVLIAIGVVAFAGAYLLGRPTDKHDAAGACVMQFTFIQPTTDLLAQGFMLSGTRLGTASIGDFWLFNERDEGGERRYWPNEPVILDGSNGWHVDVGLRSAGPKTYRIFQVGVEGMKAIRSFKRTARRLAESGNLAVPAMLELTTDTVPCSDALRVVLR